MADRPAPERVSVIALDVPFGSMVWLFFKAWFAWVLATLLAWMMIGAVGGLVFAGLVALGLTGAVTSAALATRAPEASQGTASPVVPVEVIPDDGQWHREVGENEFAGNSYTAWRRSVAGDSALYVRCQGQTVDFFFEAPNFHGVQATAVVDGKSLGIWKVSRGAGSTRFLEHERVKDILNAATLSLTADREYTFNLDGLAEELRALADGCDQ
ncbi:MAG TPA: hypothetical protein VEB22_15160 [Phycisphaerales bacterium]|nr:hypothetical protein [Phycisphaerales bacterium]